MDDIFAALGKTPHRWQAEALERVFSPEGLKSRRPILVQACTGAGKTLFQLAVVSRVLRDMRAKMGEAAKNWRCLVTVPRKSLVEQTVIDFAKALGATAVGPWFGDADKTDAPVIVACHNSLPTLVEHLTGSGLRVAFWLFDEAHRTSRNDVRDAVDILQPMTQLMVTATLKPGGILGRFPDCTWATAKQLYSYDLDTAVADGVLVPPNLVLPTPEEDAMDTNEGVIEMIRRAANPGPIVIDATDKVDAEWYAEVLTANGIPADFTHSGLGKARRKRAIDRLRSGEIRALVHVDLLTEGVDLPWIRNIVFRRARGSPIGIVQFGGRGLRPDRDGVGDALWGPKTECKILMPHATPWLRAVATTTSGLGQAIAIVAAAREEDDDTEEARESAIILPPMEAAPIIGAYLRQLADAVAGAGIPVQAPYRDIDGGRWREGTPQGPQTTRLIQLTDNGHKSPVRKLPLEHRKVVNRLIARYETMNAGQMSDLLRTLNALRSYSGWYWERHRDHWRGLDALPLRAPEIAVKSMEHHHRLKEGA